MLPAPQRKASEAPSGERKRELPLLPLAPPPAVIWVSLSPAVVKQVTEEGERPRGAR